MTPPFNWQVREHLHEFKLDGRLHILTCLLLHANIRLRSYPSGDTIKAETGYESGAITATKKWLIERRAIVLVPFKKRVDDELLLQPRSHVYQLTGIIRLDAGLIPYLYLTPETYQGLASLLSQLSDSETLKLLTQVSQTKISVSENKDNTDSFEDKRSAPNGAPRDSKPQKVRPAKPYDDVPFKDRVSVIAAWEKNLVASPANAYKTDANHNAAADILRAGYNGEQVKRYVQAMMQDAFWAGKTLTLAKVGELMPAWLAANPEGEIKFISADEEGDDTIPPSQYFKMMREVQGETTDGNSNKSA